MPGARGLRRIRTLPRRGGEVRPGIDGTRLLLGDTEETPRREREVPLAVYAFTPSPNRRALSSTACAVATTVSSSASALAARTAARLGRIASRSTMSAISIASRAARSSRVPPPENATSSRCASIASASRATSSLTPARRSTRPSGSRSRPTAGTRSRKDSTNNRRNSLAEGGPGVSASARRRRIGLEPAAAMRRRLEEPPQRRRNRGEREQRPVPRSRRDRIATLLAHEDADRQVRPRRRVARRERAGRDDDWNRRRLDDGVSREHGIEVGISDARNDLRAGDARRDQPIELLRARDAVCLRIDLDALVARRSDPHVSWTFGRGRSFTLPTALRRTVSTTASPMRVVGDSVRALTRSVPTAPANLPDAPPPAARRRRKRTLSERSSKLSSREKNDDESGSEYVSTAGGMATHPGKRGKSARR